MNHTDVSSSATRGRCQEVAMPLFSDPSQVSQARVETGSAPDRAAGVFAIETHRLSKHFGKQTAVDDLTIRVPAGTIAGFVGPNGAGKTTTIRLLLGLLRPNAGSARI